MQINLDKIVSASDLSINTEQINKLLTEKDEIIVFNNNHPQFIITRLHNNTQRTTHQGRKQGKITHEMVIGAYPILKEVLKGTTSRDSGRYTIEKKTGMNAGSAQTLITIFLSMMKGCVYKRAFNNHGTKYLLENIYADYGEEQFTKALYAAKEHAEYYATLGKGRLNNLEKLLDSLETKYL